MADGSGETMWRCPACASDDPVILGKPVDVPVLMNRLYATAAAARATPCGRLSLLGCQRCGFVWNATFQGQLVAYDAEYENDQSHSQAFRAHLTARARAVVAAVPEGPIDYLEIGCGQGGFLAEVARQAGPRLRSAVGFDPAWRQGAMPAPGVEVHPCCFDAASAGRLAHRPNLVAARHTIEHVPDPVALLASVRQALGTASAATLFLETPCAAWILANNAMQDLFYEHCSLFTAQALQHALGEAGFGAATVSHVFGGQYLWASAEAGAAPMAAAWPERAALGPLATVRQEFTRKWRRALAELAGSGPVAIWGAGAKGTSFALLVDPEAAIIHHAIDINPAKQGLFLAGTGLRVLAPDRSAGLAPASVVVMNPNYLDEIRALASRGKAAPRLIPLT